MTSRESIRRITNGVNPLRVMNNSQVFVFVDKVSFAHILVVWLAVVLGFGALYILTATPHSYLFNIRENTVTTGLPEAIYFSFVAATTTGFGDIVPLGFHRLLSVIEVVFGLLLLAVVTSKLVSMKQNTILEELYEISFHEKLQRIRSSLLLFRQNIGRLITRIEDKRLRQSELADIPVHVSSLEHVLDDLDIISRRGQGSEFAKSLDEVNAELLVNSVFTSIEKFNELLEMLSRQKQYAWKTKSTAKHVTNCLAGAQKLLVNLTELNIFSAELSAELSAQFEQEAAKTRGFLS